MREVKFQVEGVDGEFRCDADALTDYRTIKQLALAERDLGGMFEALERVYMGHDVEYVERVGGMERLEALNDAALEAAKAKKPSASSRASRSGAKR